MHKRDHKFQVVTYSQSKRREDALHKLQQTRQEIQTQNRRKVLEQEIQERWKEQEARSLADLFHARMDICTEVDNKSAEVDDSFGLMQPHWMIEYPEDLMQNWLVMARPEGRRCMLTAIKGRTISHLKNGGMLHTFKSKLPGGSSFRMDGPTILDCIFHEPDQTYYIMDLICWKGVQVHNCAAQFRLTWIKQKLVECEEISDGEEFRFEPVEWWQCTEEGLLRALYDYVPFTKDGICLVHRDGDYRKGPTELALLWKDLTCSRYLIETDLDGEPTAYQYINLRLGQDGGLYTGDQPEIKMYDVSECSLENISTKELPQPGKLMKFRSLPNQDDSSGFRLEFVSFIRNRQRNADLMSKIMFQKYARDDKIRSEDLLRCIRNQ